MGSNPIPSMMELTADDADTIEEARQLVEELAAYAQGTERTPLDAERLIFLHDQLDSLHQAVSMVVAGQEADD